MLIEPNDLEKGKLLHLAQDKTALEGLKKTFLKSFLRKRDNNDVHIKAAAGYAVDFMEEAFRDLENMVEKEKEKEQRINVV